MTQLQHCHAFFIHVDLGKQLSELFNSLHGHLCGLHLVFTTVFKDVAVFLGFAGVLGEGENSFCRFGQFVHAVTLPAE